ncbi:MAG: SPOR domain-containing protein, partial [Pseudomonadota bacterium]
MPAPEFSNASKADKAEPILSIEEDVISENNVTKNTSPNLQAWIVQVGAFGEREKAVAFKDKLVAAKFDALVEAGKSNNKEVYRVKVGPVLTQDEATKVKDRLAKEMDLDSAFVTRYPQS